jgi:hypothetical protein
MPRGFEIANPRYLASTGCDPLMRQRFGVDRCGAIIPQPRDCGTDARCPGDPGYTAPDADNSEGDGKPDWFLDCGTDRLCPGNPPEVDDPATPDVDESRDGVDNDGDGAVDDGPYPGPDANGSEGNGIFEGAWLAGHANNRPALGFLDDPSVRCLALRAAQTTAVLCSLDTLGLFYDETVRARALFKERYPLVDLDYLAISSTHTHHGVDAMGQWGHANPVQVEPGTLPGHNAFMVDQVVEAAAEAVGSLRPTSLLAASTRLDPEGYTRDARDPQVFDDTLSFLEARDEQDHSTIFTALNWSGRPAVLDAHNNLVSADFPHVLRQAVEQGLPAAGSAPALRGRGGLAIYLGGAVGGFMTPAGVGLVDRGRAPLPGDASPTTRLTAYGERLAQDVMTLLEASPGVERTTRGVLRLKAESYVVPLENTTLKLAWATGLLDRTVVDAESGLVVNPSEPEILALPLAVTTEAFTLEVGGWTAVGLPGVVFPETVVGGWDGSRSGGQPVVSPDHCPAPETCRDQEGNPCPTQRPDAGWGDCRCESCRTCTPPDLVAGASERTIQDRLSSRVTFTLGLCNDNLGSLVPAYDWEVSQVSPYLCRPIGHDEEATSVGPLALPRFLQALDKLVAFRL